MTTLRLLALATLVVRAGACPPVASAKPYPDPDAVPRVGDDFFARPVADLPDIGRDELRREARDMLLLRYDWDETRDAFTLAEMIVENSGTDAAMARTRHIDPHGSFRIVVRDAQTDEPLAYDAIGTGQEFRRLTRSLSFRVPVPVAPVRVTLTAEHPVSGVPEEVLSRTIGPADFARRPAVPVDVRRITAATASPHLIVNFYAEGYLASERARFFEDAARAATGLAQGGMPMLEYLELRAVFAPSAMPIGAARDLGLPVPERDSFLGLYFPYWRPFGRWYHVVYPTREARFRRALASAPYDYAIALINSSDYWGVGNFRELTAVPARSSSFVYLLMHELGHFFGLNEEYEGGGPTELAFAPEIDEPWSQNITFLRDPSALKWRRHVAASTPVPTPAAQWRGNGPYGAYPGGYADSEPSGMSHKPGMACTMNTGSRFCPVCTAAITERLNFDLGRAAGARE